MKLAVPSCFSASARDSICCCCCCSCSPLSSVCNFLAAHTILWLATIVHRTPTVAPYGYLLWTMRLIALFYLASAIVRFHAFRTTDYSTAR